MSKMNVTRIFLRMKELGVTQKALADDLGLDQPAVSRIVNGLTQPSDQVRKVLCRLFCSGDELFEPVVFEETEQETSKRTEEYRDYSTKLKKVAERLAEVALMVEGLDKRIQEIRR